MWSYNYSREYLCHASHKYIDKKYVNGTWRYIYQDEKGYKKIDTNVKAVDHDQYQHVPINLRNAGATKQTYYKMMENKSKNDVANAARHPIKSAINESKLKAEVKIDNAGHAVSRGLGKLANLITGGKYKKKSDYAVKVNQGTTAELEKLKGEGKYKTVVRKQPDRPVANVIPKSNIAKKRTDRYIPTAHDRVVKEAKIKKKESQPGYKVIRRKKNLRR